MSIFRMIREHDFALLPALDLRKYAWGSLEVYNRDVRERMQHYRSKHDLLSWFRFWTEDWRLGSPFKGDSKYEELYGISSRRHQKMLKRIYSTFKDEDKRIHAGYDTWNAIDSFVILENCQETANFLDFGAGYGRLGVIFGDHDKVKNYIAMDSIELPYVLQNMTLSSLFPERFYEYIEYAFEKKAFTVNLAANKNIFHIPMWKWDLIEDCSIDVVSAVFVLPEIGEFGFKEFVNQVCRTVRPGGCLYLRDHLYHVGEQNHRGGHKFDTEKVLKERSFVKVYQGEYVDNEEIYGIPRIYRFEK